MSADVATVLGTGPRRPDRWGDLRRRLASTAVLVPPIVLAIVAGGLVWAAAVAVLVALLAWEWVRLCRSPAARTGSAAAAIGWARVRRPTPGAPIARFWLPGGLLWVGAAGVAMLWLRQDAAVGLANTLFFCLVVAFSDVGAYTFGRILGGPRLAPAVSPNKTWAGAVGGLLSAMAVGGLAGYALHPPVGHVLPVAGLLAVIAMAGDLFESWIKRRCDVKDTSGLLPGHGGLLDRLDGLLAAAPFAALLAYVAGPGVPIWGGAG